MPVIDDNVAEEEEDFTLRLTTDQDDVIPNPDSTTVNIEDNEGITLGNHYRGHNSIFVGLCVQ